MTIFFRAQFIEQLITPARCPNAAFLLLHQVYAPALSAPSTTSEELGGQLTRYEMQKMIAADTWRPRLQLDTRLRFRLLGRRLWC